MPARLTQKEALQRITAAHGNEYTYPNFKYNSSRSILDINCKFHGLFQQPFNAHVYGKTGCPKCYGNEVITTEIFIRKAREIHGDKYEYTGEYIGACTPFKINCPIKNHGIFWQKPNHHITSKAGCPYCSSKLTTELFIEKAQLVHGLKYIYIKVKYIDCNEHVELICPTHGSFFSRPKIHLEGKGGCIKCAIASRTMKLLYFLQKAAKTHGGTYNYILVGSHFVSACVKVPITCDRHGVFWQEPTRHINGSGCPDCKKYVSNTETDWLDYLGVPEKLRQKTIMIGKKKIVTDAYDPVTNTIYEFNGDYWHGNPRTFPPSKLNTRTSKPYKTMKELYDQTIEREALIRSAGYNMIIIWGDEWLKQRKTIKLSY